MSISKGQIIDTYLSEIAVGFNAGDCVADEVFPVVTTDKLIGDYIVWDKKALRAPDTSRALGAPAKRTDYDYSKSTFHLPPGYTGETWVDPREVQQTKGISGLDLPKQKVMLKKADMDREKELKAAAIATNPASFNYTIPVTTNWGIAGTADIYADIINMKQSIFSQSGVMPNIMVITQDVWSKMLINERLKGFFYNTQPGAAAFDNQQIAKMFGLEDIIIPTASYTDGTGTMKFVWGTAYAAMFHRAQPVSGTIDPSALPNTFGWTLQLKGYPYVSTYFDDQRQSDIYAVNNNYLHLSTSNLACGLFTSVLG